jgi:two-component system sensor histidine kinase BarA
LRLNLGALAPTLGPLTSGRARGEAASLEELAGRIRQAIARRDNLETSAGQSEGDVGALVVAINELLADVRLREAELTQRAADLEKELADQAPRRAENEEAPIAAPQPQAPPAPRRPGRELGPALASLAELAELLAVADVQPTQRRIAELISKSSAALSAAAHHAAETRLDAGSVDPAEAIEDMISLYWERARDKSLDLALFVDPQTPSLIETDANRLRQLVGRLVGNAIRFTNAGAIMVQAAPKGDVLRVAVRDTGPGLSKDQLAGLFDVRTGGGLAACQEVAQAMGGRISVASEIGKGALFALDLPLKTLEPAPAWPSLDGETAALRIAGPATRSALQRYLKASGVILDVGPDTPGLVIGESSAIKEGARAGVQVICLSDRGDRAAEALKESGLVDLALPQPLRRGEVAAALTRLAQREPLGEALAGLDAEAAPRFSGRRVLAAASTGVVRQSISEALARLGCEVVLLADGREAVAAATSDQFDLILFDARLSGLDGGRAVAEIRLSESAEKAKTPIIGVTSPGEGSAAWWRDSGADGVLLRPFTVASLAATVAKFIPPTPAAPPRADPAPTGTEPKPLTATLGAAAADLLDPQVAGELARLVASGKGDFVVRVRRLYRENAPNAVKALIEASTKGDCDAAAKAAHALKSMSLNMGARLVAETAARLETQARDLRIVNVDQAQVLHRQLLATLDVLEGYPPEVRPASPGAGAPPEEQTLLADLAKAIDNNELTLVYQPQFDREGETITGVETLVRWTHPTRGFVSPAFFIPLAERYGLIGRVTQWVLARAMEETRDLGDFTLSFNASAVEFAEASFVDELAVLIARCGFDPKRLEIEVTETAVLSEEDEVRRNMARLHELGLKIALDDFGVGYSSLSHLRLFPFDKLKIDRAFVTGCAENVQSATLVHAVVSIGRALGMKVVAEGVETEAQRKFLKVAGVHAMQGYLFAKPEPVDALRARLNGEIQQPEAPVEAPAQESAAVSA